MPEATITVTNNGGGEIVAGTRVLTTNWSAGLGHAALVTSTISRADGFDFWLRHTSTGKITSGGATGLNTANCRFEFLTQVDLAAAASDNGYRLVYGHLGWQATPFSTIAGATDVNLAVGISVPALTLPAPSFPLERTEIIDTIEQDWFTPRRTRLNFNDRARFTGRWANLPPHYWYEMRAFQKARFGGATTFAAPSWLGGSLDCRIIEAHFEQSSRLGYHATMVLETVAA